MWADNYIKELQAGRATTFKPVGRSMEPKIFSGDAVVCVPTKKVSPVEGDIVLVKVAGNVYLHLIKKTEFKNGQINYLIGNNKGRINGWVTPDSIFGVCVSVENIPTKAAKRCLPE